MLPTILRGAAAVKSGSDKLILASRLNKIAANPLVSGLARATGGHRSPLLNGIGSYISKVKDPKKEKKSKDDSEPKPTSTKNRDKAKDDSEKNQERQDKAEKDSVKGSEENVSLLKVIAKDTVRVRDAVESLVKDKEDAPKKTGGILGGITSALTSFLPMLLGGKGGGVLAKLIAKAGAATAKVGGSVLRVGSKVLGIGAATGTAAAAGSKVAGSLGRHALRDPKTGRYIAKAAEEAIEAAPKGILGKAGAMAGRAGGLFGKIGGKGAGMLGKGVAKAAGKSLVKKIPIIGAIAGLGFAANRAMAGDWTGAGMEAASGLAGTVPGVGTAASLGIDAAIIARDMKRAGSRAAPAGKPTTAVAARAAAVSSRRPASTVINPLNTISSTLSVMLNQMTDKTKGIYTLPAESSDSLIARAQEAAKTAGADFSNVQSGSSTIGPADTGSVNGTDIGPPTMGTGGLNDGSSLNRNAKPLGKTKSEFYDQMYKMLLESAQKQGVENPESIARLGAAQSSLETGYGKHAPGNNYFGIKGKGGTQSTREFINGKWVTINDSFRGYRTANDSADDYIKFLQKNKRYKGVLSAGDAESAISAQGRTGYATDPDYARKLMSIHRSATARNSLAGVNDPKRAMSAVGASPTTLVRESAVAKSQQKSTPVIISAPQVAVASGKGNGANRGSAPSGGTPVLVRNPDSPVRANVNALIRTT